MTEPCEFVPPHEPWSCRVHGGIRTRLDVTACSRIVPARLEPDDTAAHIAWLREDDRLARALWPMRPGAGGFGWESFVAVVRGDVKAPTDTQRRWSAAIIAALEEQP